VPIRFFPLHSHFSNFTPYKIVTIENDNLWNIQSSLVFVPLSTLISFFAHLEKGWKQARKKAKEVRNGVLIFLGLSY